MRIFHGIETWWGQQGTKMAEIKSTMELVMEKLAALDKISDAELSEEEYLHEGMRIGAAYLRGEEEDLNSAVRERPEKNRPLVLKGAVKTLLRNIVLPRDEDYKQSAEKAMQGLLELGQGAGDLYGIFGDLKTILDQYLQHRAQLRKQLQDAFARQTAQLEDSLAQQTGMNMKIDVSQHPKFREEWQKIQSELNEQYGRALEQQKTFIAERLASSAG